jgi:hypothetical protein
MRTLGVFLVGFVFSLSCQGAEVFCGRLERYSFPGPDEEEFHAFVLRFEEERKIEFSSWLQDGKILRVSVEKLQISPSLEGKNKLRVPDLVARLEKKVCLSGELMESHTAHHVPPVLLVDPVLEKDGHRHENGE